VIPRYAEERIFQELTFQDYGWPALPKLDKVNPIPEGIFLDLVLMLKRRLANITG
jgi:hypothetical protein